MGIAYKPKLTEYSLYDFKKLDGSQKKQILKSFRKIEKQGMNAGQQLHGKLSDCRKLKHKTLGLRVVFRQSQSGIEIIEIVVIGKREDNDVYSIAEKRLGR
jgi:mRNA interferase RelE/StbE